MTEEKGTNTKGSKKEKRNEKKLSKRPREEEDHADRMKDTSRDESLSPPPPPDDAPRVARHHQRRQERELLLERVPKVDEHGIAYTKQQIRRMRKRVARGLDPVETAAEQQARVRQEAELRRQEEAELTEMLAEPSQKSAENRSEADSDPEEEDNDDEGEPEHVPPEEIESETEEDPFAYEKKGGSILQGQRLPPRKKKKRIKTVPSDYVCSACQNKHSPVHWIYDCPDKHTVRGTNQVAKRQRGLHSPSDCKLFVSGLPFECKPSDVITLLGGTPATVPHCKLVKFPDTGRCKGQAYVTFASAEDAQAALKLNGTTIPNIAAVTPQKGGAAAESKRTELKLKVTKVLNRFQTKQQKK